MYLIFYNNTITFTIKACSNSITLKELINLKELLHAKVKVRFTGA